MNAKTYEGDICSLYPEHGRSRYVSNGNCVACAKERAASYQRANPDRHRERVKRYSANNPDLVKPVKYSAVLRALANDETDVILFVANLFGKTVDEVLLDLDLFKKRNL